MARVPVLSRAKEPLVSRAELLQWLVTRVRDSPRFDVGLPLSSECLRSAKPSLPYSGSNVTSWKGNKAQESRHPQTVLRATSGSTSWCAGASATSGAA